MTGDGKQQEARDLCTSQLQIDKLHDLWVKCSLREGHQEHHRGGGKTWENRQPSHASGEGTEEAAQLADAYDSGEPGQAKDITLKIGEIFDSSSTRKYESILELITKVQREAQQAMAEKAAQHDDQTTFGEHVAAMIDKLLSDKYTNSHKIVAGIIDQELRRSLAGAEPQQPYHEFDRSFDSVEPPQDKLAALVAKWRKIAAECPSKYRNKWRDVFEAVETCASELEHSLAGAEPQRKYVSLDTAQLGQEPHFGSVEDADSTFCDDPKCWCATKDYVCGYNDAVRKQQPGAVEPPQDKLLLNSIEIETLLHDRFGVSSVTGLADIAWLTDQLNKLIAAKAREPGRVRKHERRLGKSVLLRRILRDRA